MKEKVVKKLQFVAEKVLWLLDFIDLTIKSIIGIYVVNK